jgi:outer membrane protein TolC
VGCAAWALLGAAAAAAGTPATPPPLQLSPRWTLAEAVATALARHPSVGAADAETRAAAARLGLAASVRYPQVGAQGGYTFSESPSSSTGAVIAAKTGLVQGTVTQLLTDFGRTGASVSSASALADATAESARSSRVDVAFAAEVAWFNVLRARNVVGVLREAVHQRDSFLKQAQAFYESGLKARIDVVRAEASLLQAQADLTSAELEYKNARLLLLARMGIDGPTEFELADPPAVPERTGDLESWMREADEGHPDLKALRLQVIAAQESVKAAAGASWPTIAASGRYGWTWDDEPPSQPLDRTWAAGLQLTVPIFTGYAIRNQTAEAEARLASATFALEDRRRQVLLLVEQAVQSIASAEERLRVRTKEREAFAENLRLATGRYEEGAGDVIEMIDAQAQMAQAEDNLVGAKFDRAVAIVSLTRALGRLPQL